MRSKTVVEIFKNLVLVGALVGVLQSVGLSAGSLHDAVKQGDLATVKQLVEKEGAKIDAKDEWGRTAFHLAAQNEDLVIVKYLVAHGADIGASNNYARILLQTAAFFGRFAVIEYLKLVEDFYRVVASEMVLSNFLKKYCETQEAAANKQNLADIRNLLHLGSQNLANKFYDWCEEKKHFAVDDKWVLGRAWMYFDLLRKAIDAPKKSYWCGFFLNIASQDLKESTEVKIFFKKSANWQLQKAYAERTIKQNMKQLALQAKLPFVKSALNDLKIKFQ